MTTLQLRALLTTLAVLPCFAGRAATLPGGPARAFLSTSLNLTETDFKAIDAGQVFSRTMDVKDPREIAALGVVRIRITPEFYVQRLADIAKFKQDPAVLQIGAFGNPPRLEDISTLTLDDSDIRSLARCRVGNCGLRLSAEHIARFQHGVNWAGADPTGQANALMRKILVEHVANYRAAGTSMQYADQAEPLDVAGEFDSLTKSNTGGWQSFPRLLRHLCEYPAADTAETSDLVYWSKERIGRRGVVSLTHLAVAHTAHDSPADYVIASKHLYGTHYVIASLGLAILVPDRAASSPATYLAYVNRSRADIFDGIFGGVARRLVASRARATVSEQLGRLQRNLEREFTSSQVH